MDGNADPVAITGKGLVHAVVQDLEYEMVETPRARVPDVHIGTLPDGFEAGKDFNFFRCVQAVYLGLRLFIQV
jgi:hypothetical protein